MQDVRGGGGAEKVIANLTLALGNCIDFILLVPHMIVIGDHQFPYCGKVVRVEMQWNKPTRGLLQKVGKLFYRLSRLRQIIREENPDVILSNFSYVWHHLIIILKLCRLTRKKAILRFGNPVSQDIMQRGKLYALLFRIGIRNINRVIVISQGLADDLIETLGTKTENVVVINNPIQFNEIQILSHEAVYDAPFQGDLPVILTAGRLAPQKNHRLLLKAFGKVREHVNARLAILGMGTLEGELSDQARKLGLHESVYFLGWQSNPFKYMSKADLFVLSSNYEGFGTVLLEAMACGCPVISTDCPYGPSEILGNGKYGILVPVGDEESMAKEILRVLQEEELQRTLSERGMQRAIKFDANMLVDQYALLFRELAQLSLSSN